MTGKPGGTGRWKALDTQEPASPKGLVMRKDLRGRKVYFFMMTKDEMFGPFVDRKVAIDLYETMPDDMKPFPLEND